MRVLILEDNRDRRVAMISRLMERFAFLRIVFFESAPEMVKFLQSESLDDVALVALDHDLELIPNGGHQWIDPGTGLDAVDGLIANVKPRFPVIVHSTNGPAASQMMMRLLDAGWNAHRVVPYGDLEWIDKEWFLTARNAIVSTAPKVIVAT
jgi:CheY-like chemotaxis protein